MSALRTVIVDDEPIALDFLGLLLQAHHDIEVVARCENGREAIKYLNEHHADLLFLDVQMPTTDGFGVVEQVGVNRIPSVIFVTAFNEHAVRAFDIHAVDYLTKPVDAERLTRALGRVREKIAAKAALLTQEQLAAVLNGLRSVADGSDKYASRFLVKDGEKEIFLPVEAIDWIEAAAYYSCLHADSRRYMLRETIADLSEKLDPKKFARIHRSAIVNLDRVREIYREGQAEGSVVLTNGQKLRMSRSGRQKLTEIGRA